MLTCLRRERLISLVPPRPHRLNRHLGISQTLGTNIRDCSRTGLVSQS
jgi:hypothetical protein